MEAEIFPASLREHEIPHRTQWNQSGTLEILVLDEWTEDATSLLEETSRTFFKEELDKNLMTQSGSEATEKRLVIEDPDEDDEDDEEDNSDSDLISTEPLFVKNSSLKVRPVWPAWLLASIPSTGLGHLYAGKFQIFLYLFFMSVLGILFYNYTKSYYSFLFNLFSWVIDLGFSAYYVKENNRRARRLMKLEQDMEKEFLDTIQDQK
jgi:hypothetical protein